VPFFSRIVDDHPVVSSKVEAFFPEPQITGMVIAIDFCLGEAPSW
jgi:hypothetical protein